MHAIYISEYIPEDFEQELLVSITDKKKLFHLTQVLRIKQNESILILDGKGNKAVCKIVSINRKELFLRVIKKEISQKKFNLDLALCIPKKEYLEDIIKMSVELGIAKIIPLVSKFSHGKSSIGMGNRERLDRLIESAMIQSNNPFKLEIAEAIDLMEISSKLKSKYQQIFFFCEHIHTNESADKYQFPMKALSFQDPTLLIIGAEGGFAVEEDVFIQNISGIKRVHLPTQILRCPTAVCAATGFILAHILDS
ncbi:MAG: 16S rRNA (uracil(1498)-N(3))-methyltransferase [Oligoflexia bacterium]|nr:16S rRNA (uracil(1498)-N(3))-methyltransferase [Oligoflexia bacterium]